MRAGSSQRKVYTECTTTEYHVSTVNEKRLYCYKVASSMTPS